MWKTLKNNFLRLINWKICDSTKPKVHFKHFQSGLITTTAIVFEKAALKGEVVLANNIFTSVGSEQKFILERSLCPSPKSAGFSALNYDCDTEEKYSKILLMVLKLLENTVNLSGG